MPESPALLPAASHCQVLVQGQLLSSRIKPDPCSLQLLSHHFQGRALDLSRQSVLVEHVSCDAATVGQNGIEEVTGRNHRAFRRSRFSRGQRENPLRPAGKGELGESDYAAVHIGDRSEKCFPDHFTLCASFVKRFVHLSIRSLEDAQEQVLSSDIRVSEANGLRPSLSDYSMVGLAPRASGITVDHIHSPGYSLRTNEHMILRRHPLMDPR